MINILVEGMTNSKGGKETYIINMFNFMDKTKYRFIFIAYDDEIAYEEYLKNAGAEVIHVAARHKGLFKHRKELCCLFETKHVDVVWAHKTTLSACEILSIAKTYRVPVRIVHSHSSQNMGGKFTYFMHKINQKFVFDWANVYMACSEVAAKWFYGNHPAIIIKNGIDLEKFKFSQELRDKIRNRLKLQNDFVIGHIGRFGKEKNHKKLIDVFYEYKKLNPHSKLVLCGDGEERANIEHQIKSLSLENDVILLGVIDNVHEILQAIDIIVMPSLFEGLPFALLEAQAAGLKCIVSDTVSKEADVTGWNTFLPLDGTDEMWANYVYRETVNGNREVGNCLLNKAGFNIKEAAYFVEKIIGLNQ